ncbi:hypothetical protein MASR2M69_05480 [Bacteroidota bacterium]
MNTERILNKAIEGEDISAEEALILYTESPVPELLKSASEIRQKMNPGRGVSWQIDRNVNYTNVCISGCKFCNFHCTLSQKSLSYTTTIEEYREKIDELVRYGGDQLLIQGGLHPHYDINFYEDLFTRIKESYPFIKLNALGPPEVSHIAKLSKLTIEETLKRLVNAGLDTLPGAGAEIYHPTESEKPFHQVNPASKSGEMLWSVPIKWESAPQPQWFTVTLRPLWSGWSTSFY